jgi:hypothetical protein
MRKSGWRNGDAEVSGGDSGFGNYLEGHMGRGRYIDRCDCGRCDHCGRSVVVVVALVEQLVWETLFGA